MSIEQQNRIIAEFMGGIYLRKQDPFDNRIIEFIRFEKGVFRDMCWNGKNGAAVENTLGELLYHNYWDWLMPVVEKISRIPLIGAESSTHVCYPVTFNMPNEDGKPMVRFCGFSLHTADTLIEAAYSAVVEVIEFVNSENIKA